MLLGILAILQLVTIALYWWLVVGFLASPTTASGHQMGLSSPLQPAWVSLNGIVIIQVLALLTLTILVHRSIIRVRPAMALGVLLAIALGLGYYVASNELGQFGVVSTIGYFGVSIPFFSGFLAMIVLSSFVGMRLANVLTGQLRPRHRSFRRLLQIQLPFGILMVYGPVYLLAKVYGLLSALNLNAIVGYDIMWRQLLIAQVGIPILILYFVIADKVQFHRRTGLIITVAEVLLVVVGTPNVLDILAIANQPSGQFILYGLAFWGSVLGYSSVAIAS